MFWFILGLIVFVAYTVCVWCDDTNYLSEKMWYSIAALMVSALVSLLALLIASGVISNYADVDYKIVSDTKIIALKDNTNAIGSIYIMGGYVDENLYYYYATETEFGYKTEKIVANNAYIRYTDGEARIEKYKAEFVNDNVSFFAFIDCPDRYVIYCPEGTITNEFNVDLE